jgi:uncharacterized Fe-S cluster protein YjdI
MTEPSPEQERGPRRAYANDATEVHWEPKVCIHVRNCVRGLPDVFDPERRPWVDVDAADADAIAATILTCPTGALHFRRLDGGAQDEEPSAATVEPRPDGPLFVRGHVRIVDNEGRLIREDTRLAPAAAARLETSRSVTAATAGSASQPHPKAAERPTKDRREEA